MKGSASRTTRAGRTSRCLDSHSYEAPGFYRRLGYKVIGELPGWPGDDTRIFLGKTLA